MANGKYDTHNLLTASTGRRAFVSGLMGFTAALASGTALAGRAGDGPIQILRNYNQPKQPPSETRVITDRDVPPMLAETSEHLLYDAISRYEIYEARGYWPAMPPNVRIKPGQSGPVVTRLRQRLAAEGYLPYEATSGDRYDQAVLQAVERFQIAHGFRADGVVGPETVRKMTIPPSEKIRALRANLPRVREYAKDLGDRYIVVNIPATQLDAVENGLLASRHRVIVGMSERPSPILASQVSQLNFNPYWNAPESIVIRDIIPQVKKDFSTLEKLSIKVHDGYNGPAVDPTTLDWNNIDTKRYFFRQDPGEANAMASVKINFPNQYAVYMHDTPTKKLFSESERYFSSGCVRVDQVHVLTTWILNGQDGWTRATIDQVEKNGDRVDIDIAEKTGVHFAYMTAWVTADGLTHFRDDIYNLDGTDFIAGQPEALPGPPDLLPGITTSASAG